MKRQRRCDVGDLCIGSRASHGQMSEIRCEYLSVFTVVAANVSDARGRAGLARPEVSLVTAEPTLDHSDCWLAHETSFSSLCALSPSYLTSPALCCRNPSSHRQLLGFIDLDQAQSCSAASSSIAPLPLRPRPTPDSRPSDPDCFARIHALHCITGACLHHLSESQLCSERNIRAA